MPAGTVEHHHNVLARLVQQLVSDPHGNGLLTVGQTIADAFMNMYRLESTCQIQLSAQAGGELIHFGDEIYTGDDSAAVYVRSGGKGGSFVWPALLRKLDRIDTSYQN